MTVKLTNNESTVPAHRNAIFAGSFNPFTAGHASIVKRGLELFDNIIIAIGRNIKKENNNQSDILACKIADLYNNEPRVRVIIWNGLMVDLARKENVHFFLRGVRNVVDFEYERNMADINRQLAGIETVLLFALPEHAALSSSVVRELQAYDVDVSSFLPE